MTIALTTQEIADRLGISFDAAIRAIHAERIEVERTEDRRWLVSLVALQALKPVLRRENSLCNRLGAA